MNNAKGIRSVFGSRVSSLILSLAILAIVALGATPAFAQGEPPQGPPPGAGANPSQWGAEQQYPAPDQQYPAPDQDYPAPEQAETKGGQPPAAPQGYVPQQMETLPQPSEMEPKMGVAYSVVAGAEMNVWIDQGCESTYYVQDHIQFTVDVGDWSAYYPQQNWWRYLEVWGSTNGAWWHPVVSGRWVQPTDSIVESARISRPVGVEMLYARLLDYQGHQIAWATCKFNTHEYQQPPAPAYDPVIKLLKTGYGHDGYVVNHALVFRVKAYDPYVGTHDGDGIAYVDMEIYNWQGYKVYSKRENYAGYCGFGGGTPYCSVYHFGHNHYRWPNGTPIGYGEYTLKATAHTHDGRYATLYKTIKIQ